MTGNRVEKAYPRHFSQKGDVANTDSGADHVWPKLLQTQERRTGPMPTAHVVHGHRYLCSIGHVQQHPAQGLCKRSFFFPQLSRGIDSAFHQNYVPSYPFLARCFLYLGRK